MKHHRLNLKEGTYIDSGEKDGLVRCTYCHELMLPEKLNEECSPKGYILFGQEVLTPYIPLML